MEIASDETVPGKIRPAEFAADELRFPDSPALEDNVAEIFAEERSALAALAVDLLFVIVENAVELLL